MGQILGQDQIATPSHSSGTIVLPPSLLTLGGRQYSTATLSRTISADVTLAANVLYFVYAQIVSGVPVLRISLSAPSSYKILNPTALLVTAFYSNGVGSIVFGSFVNIEGIPETKEISYDPQINAQGLGTLTAIGMGWRRRGNLFMGAGTLFVGTRTAVEARIGMPFPVEIIGTSNQLCGTVGFGGTTTVTYGLIAGTTGNPYVIPTYNSSGGNGMNTGVLGTTIFGDGQKILPHWQIPIQGWSNTPLKDL